jgi:AcrR family transcriptional regulator
MTKPMLYRHWESKQELAIALFERHREELVGAALGIYDPDDSDRVAQIEAMAGAWFEHARQHADATRFLNVPVTGDPELERVQRDLHARQRATLAALLRDLAASSGTAFPDADYEPMGEAVRASLASLAHWWTDHPDVPCATLVRVVTQMVRGLIGPPAEASEGERPSRQ